MVVFTMVTEETKDIALPLSTVWFAFPAVEKVTPELAIIVPTIVPPPALLIVAELPTYQKTFLANPPFIIITLLAPVGPAIPTVSPEAV
jgi:hypothetical protein